MTHELSYLIKLLDDPDPTVQESLKVHFAQYEGDVSEIIAGYGLTLQATERVALSRYLLPGRRRTLIDQWNVSYSSLTSPEADWENFEALLSALSDYLHDGITLRPSLADSLDQVADEASLAEASASPTKLAHFLFTTGRFQGNHARYFSKENSDLVWVIDNALGNPISLAVLYILLGARFGLTISGCNYPGHFLAWVSSEDSATLVDCYNRGRLLYSREILSENKDLSEHAREALSTPCSLLAIIHRTLNNMETSFRKEGLLSEITLLGQLKKSLLPQPSSP